MRRFENRLEAVVAFDVAVSDSDCAAFFWYQEHGLEDPAPPDDRQGPAHGDGVQHGFVDRGQARLIPVPPLASASLTRSILFG